MSIEETVLDPPFTPAPVFAYRAIRGWFVGSPDSSPERDNKENISPAKSYYKSLDGEVGEDVPRLSPQKRKRDSTPLVSPTKSILRTPGAAPTPRAKSLRDMNVKFKSLSPEVRRTGPSQTVAQPAQAGATEPEIVNKPMAKDSVNATTTARQPSVPASSRNSKPNETQPEIVPEAHFEDHFRRTEKEMKKLIRYGQKWRDFARRQDEENARLRVLLEELYSENRRLEAALTISGVEDGKNQVGPKALPLPTRNIKEITGKGFGGEKAAATVTGKRASTNPTLGDGAVARDIEDLLDLTPPQASTTATIAQRSTSAPDPKAASKELVHSQYPPTSKPISSHLPQPQRQQRLASTSIATHSQSPLTALQHRIEGSVLPISDTAVRARIPPERLAAVRKRLMAKDQVRRAGLSVLQEVQGNRDSDIGHGRGVGNGSFGSLVTGKGTEFPGKRRDGDGGRGNQKRLRIDGAKDEESGVDWVGI